MTKKSNIAEIKTGCADMGDTSSLSSGTKESAKLASNEAFFISEKKSGVKKGISFKEYRKLCMARREIKPPYKTPKIIRSKGGDWYIQYFYEHPDRPGEWNPFKIRSGLNYIKDPVKKEVEYGFLRNDVEDWLKDGNGPYTKDDEVLEWIEGMEKKIDAIELANSGWKIKYSEQEYIKHITFKGLSYNTIRTYKKYVRRFREWCVENEYADKPVSQINEFDLEEFLNEAAEGIKEGEKPWGGRTYNNYLKYYGGFFDKVQALEKRENKKNGRSTNIVYQINTKDIEKRVTNPQRNKAYSPELADAIKKALLKKGRENLHDYIAWISLSFMRPDEIRHLKVENIDHRSRQIRFVGKTGDRIVPISDQLMKLINKRQLLQHTQKSFVFGKMGSVSEQRMSVAYFLEQYAELKVEIGTDTKLGPYNWKHTYVQLMKNAGFTDEEIMMITGHKTIEAFRAYLADFYIDRSHLMKGSTVDF